MSEKKAPRQRVREQDFVYYVHSYFAADCQEYIVADSDYGLAIPGIVQKTMSSALSFTQKKAGQSG